MRGHFSFRWNYITFETPSALKGISPAVFARERKKAEQMWTEAGVSVRDALRESLATLVGNLADKLTGQEDGTPKRFKEASVRNVTEFLDLFEKRDITRDAELGKLVRMARRVLTGIDAKSLRDDAALRTRVGGAMGKIQTSLTGMLEVKPGRRVRFDAA